MTRHYLAGGMVRVLCCDCEACKGWEQDRDHCFGTGRVFWQVYRRDREGWLTTRLGVDEEPVA